MRVVAVDKDAGDNGRVSYVISSGNDEGHLTIGQESGVVSLVKPIVKPSNFEITANDHGTPPRKATFNITLTTDADQGTKAPRLLLSNLVARVSENHRVGTDIISVARVLASDQGMR